MKKLTFSKVMNNMIALEAVIDDTLFARKEDESHTGRNLAIGAGGLGLGTAGLGYAGRNSEAAEQAATRGARWASEKAGGKRWAGRAGGVAGRGYGSVIGGAQRTAAGTKDLFKNTAAGARAAAAAIAKRFRK